MKIVRGTNCIFRCPKKVNHNSYDNGKDDEDNNNNRDTIDDNDNGFINGGNVA